MASTAAKACCVLVILASTCEKCYSLQGSYTHDVENDLEIYEDSFSETGINQYNGLDHQIDEEILKPHPITSQDSDIVKLLLGGKWNRNENNIQYNEIEDEPRSYASKKIDSAMKSRVSRQAYDQATVYPKLPSSAPHNQYTNNNQYSSWQPSNSYSRPGYSSNSQPLPQNTTYAYNTPNPAQSTNTGPSLYQNNPAYNSGYSQSPYIQTGKLNQTQHPGIATNTQGARPGTTYPYNPQDQIPLYSSSTPRSHPVVYDNSSKKPFNYSSTIFGSNVRPPYNTLNGQTHFHPNSPYGQNISNGRPYPNPSPGNIYSANTVRPGQFPYNPQGSNQHPYNPQGLNQNPYNQQGYNQNPYNPQGLNQNPYNPQGLNQNPYNPQGLNQNSYNQHGLNQNPYNPQGLNQNPYNPQGQNQNPYNPQRPYQSTYNNPQSSQYPGTNYPGYSNGPDTFNLAHNAYNPSIPSRPPYAGPT